MKVDKLIKAAHTVEQFRVLQYLTDQRFAAESFDVEPVDRYSIKATDATGASLIFYWDPDAGEVKWHD